MLMGSLGGLDCASCRACASFACALWPNASWVRVGDFPVSVHVVVVAGST